jgi:HEAT repeat protein
VKKWIALIVLLALGGGGFYVWRTFRQGARLSAPDEVKDLTGDEVRSGLSSPDPKARLDALAQIEKLPEPERKAALIAALGAPYAPTRLTAVTALAKTFPTDPVVVEGLLAVAKEDLDSDVREAAFAALAPSGDVRVLDLSLSVLTSSEEPIPVRLGAARTLDRLTGRDTASRLRDLLDQAESEADDLMMDWDDWLSEHREGLRWNAETGRFTE